VLLYTFHRLDDLSLKRLKHLKSMNHDTIIVPCFGVKQNIYIPIIFNVWEPVTSFINWNCLRPSSIFRLNEIFNKKLELFRRRTELNEIGKIIRLNNMILYYDFTPMGYRNLDLSMIKWFSNEGKKLDFEYCILYEYDIYTTKIIEDIYDKYTKFDAAFVNYGIALPNWYWYRYPPGARGSTLRWLKKKGLKPLIYMCSPFAGSMVSKNALENLVDLNLPFGISEMRLPTVLTALGFNCGRLDFPKVRYRPICSKTEVEDNLNNGIFHPVYDFIENRAREVNKI